MQVKLLKSKIHRATVTNSDLNYQGSIAIDQNLLEAATIRPFESVHVWNVTNGSRLETYALPADARLG
jgi:aspartate 1-decarboxylase